MMAPRYLAVAGNMGAGKSSLVKWLHATFDLKPIYEPQDDNPYLEDFYRDMKRWAFSSQLFFLVRRFRMQRELERSLPSLAHRGVALDRSIYEDAEIFAAHHRQVGNIDARDWRTYQDLYEAMRAELRPPDLMVYLRCPVGALRRRIQQRGRSYEQVIPTGYLRALDRLYEDWFAHYDLSPTLVIDTSEVDYVEDLFHREALLDEIGRRL
ncbi:MAG: deoxynucleoside kinase [Myxococcales bacterium]|nr:deoxynucleoside kinase [Polyangiaceae bacterium]MDW8249880.1 deoxynucleoside kinase [Myxococcales bacterium]